MGGVTMTIDQNVKSEHLQPNGKPRPRYARCADNTCAHPYYGPQAQYKPGTYHLEGWQALDYVRQRYGLPNGDYDRQRHQQQFIKAMAQQALSKDVVTNPVKLDKVLKAAGSALIFDGKGHDVVDWGFALKNIRSGNMTLIKLPGKSLLRGRDVPGRGAGPERHRLLRRGGPGRPAELPVRTPGVLQQERVVRVWRWPPATSADQPAV